MEEIRLTPGMYEILKIMGEKTTNLNWWSLDFWSINSIMTSSAPEIHPPKKISGFVPVEGILNRHHL